jgi:hypothetical protein
MKQLLTGVLAIALAFGATAFTNAAKEKATSYYWFELNTDGTQKSTTQMPVLQSSDPLGCNAINAFCSRGYTSYEAIPDTNPVQYRGVEGTEGPTHKKN